MSIDGTPEFIYHLSDDTNKDSTLTSTILKSIIEQFPRVIRNRTLVIRSDNASTQYKSKYVFKRVQQIAQENNINIFWFYGEPGHGRGLVDAMSSFGCKKVIRDAIITRDEWFPTALSMFNHLKNHFQDDNKKHYFLVDENATAAMRKKMKKCEEIKGCMSFHIIGTNPEGGIMTRKQLSIEDSKLMNLEFEANYKPSDDSSIDGVEEELPQYADADPVSHPLVFEIIQEGTFVAMRSAKNSTELFYISEVVGKGVAPTYIEDASGHGIAAGEVYVTVKYLEKQSEKKDKVIYKYSKAKPSYIHMGEIFATNIQMLYNLTMPISEYQSLCAEIY